MKDFSVKLIFVLAAIYIFVIFNSRKHIKEDHIVWDIKSYYAYLPAAIIHHDMSFRYLDKLPPKERRHYWGIKMENGSYAIKMSMGLSFLYLPFFLIAHFIAGLTGQVQNGFSQPYHLWIALSAVFYAIAGLLILRKSLLEFYNEKITTLVILIIAAGTNFVYYSTYQAPMAHVFNFFLFAVFFRYTIKWYNAPRWKYTIILGLTSGLITLIRPTNIIIWLMFVFYGVTSWKDIPNRIMFFLKYWKYILTFGILTLAVFTPQLFFWKAASGKWWYYSYRNESFFFASPKIWKGLFGWRKGLFIYTPLMIFGWLGFYWLAKKNKALFIPMSIFTIVHTYVVFSWWCWWYGGGFSARALIESFALWAFPLGAFLQFIYTHKNRLLKINFSVLITALIILNGIQTYQANINVIHYDAMTRKAYFASFLKLKRPEGYSKLLKEPDFGAAMNGKKEYANENK